MPSEEGKKKATRYRNEFNARNYERLNIFVPMGRKRAVEACAREAGESVNAYTNRLYREDMGLTEAAWKGGEGDA